jgi:FdhD protein
VAGGRTVRRRVARVTVPGAEPPAVGARRAGVAGESRAANDTAGNDRAANDTAGNGTAGNDGAANDTAGQVTWTERADLLAAEEPLGIRVDGTALTMTMRTPGDDVELAAGFLVGEAIVRGRDDIAAMKVCDGTSCGHLSHAPGEIGNIVDIALAPGVTVSSAARRSFMTTSACGVCGKTSIDDICVLPQAPLAADATVFRPAWLTGLPDRLREAQRVFASTGGLHAAGLFTADGELLAAREDVGRHNAVDKIVGWALLHDKLPLTGCALLVSGRASFELVQKAVLAGIPLLAAVSAPSSLAAELAEEAGLTLVGFLRGQSMNVYTGLQRVAPLT